MAAPSDPIDIGGTATPTGNAVPMTAQTGNLTSPSCRRMASNGWNWFAWGFIAGLGGAGLAVYLIRKKL